jgi:hypothetical protein
MLEVVVENGVVVRRMWVAGGERLGVDAVVLCCFAARMLE